jgi:hypothetical protein
VAAPLPYLQTADDGMNQVQSTWAAILNPVLSSPLATPVLLRNVKLVAGANSISHTLARRLQGWQVVRVHGTATAIPLVSNWTAWTPTGTWVSNTTYTGFRRITGDTAEYIVKVALTGAPTAATLNVTLPATDTIDATKLISPYLPSANSPIGQSRTTAAAANALEGIVVYASTTTVSPRYFAVSGTTIVGNPVTNVAPGVFANGDGLYMRFSVPLVGLSTALVSSPDIYDAQDSNPIPDKTLTLVASAAATVDLLVF